jgi:hypothetical protein
MRKPALLLLCMVVSLFALVDTVWAAYDSFADRFIQSPLLVLAALLIIDIVAFAYYKLRK